MKTRLMRDRDSLSRPTRRWFAIVVLGAALCVPQISFAQSEEAPAESDPAPTSDADEAAPSEETPLPVSTPGSQAYDYKLRALEERVVNLKEKIFRTKTRLLLL
ncbi:MAG: hypothetical protein QF464_15595, partial [Myxococcota bacterium]|nr:hypothetical protein [Myxococcota bacterium]